MRTTNDVREDIIVKGESYGILTDDFRDAQVIWEVFVDEVYSRMLRPDGTFAGETVLDIGGHVGSFSKWAQDHGAKRVVALEPYPPSQRTFRRWSSRPGGVCELIPAGIARKAGETTLSVKTRGNTFSGSTHSERITGQLREIHLTVPTVSLADILEEYRPEKIKCDCEGAELEIFAPPLPDLSFVQAMTMEVHVDTPAMVEQANIMIDALAADGFTVMTDARIKKPSGWPTIKHFYRKESHAADRR